MAKIHMHRQRPPLLLWPFWAIWRLVSGILELTGRLAAVIIGIVFMIVGAVLTALVIPAIIGIPLMIFGFLLTVRGIF